MRLDLVVGPNGAGKTTFVDLVLNRAVMPHSPFVNADLIAVHRWPHDPETHSYEAARIAERTRAELIAARRPFLAETVFSHPSKLDLITEAHAAGYVVALHALMVPEDLCVHRVQYRVRAGGHPVPERKIRERYQRLWPLVATAINLADSAVVYDNSHRDGPRELARFIAGRKAGASTWPMWTPAALRALS